MVPLANMLGYDGELSSLSEGQAVYTMQSTTMRESR